MNTKNNETVFDMRGVGNPPFVSAASATKTCINGDGLAKLRHELKLSQCQLAEILGFQCNNPDDKKRHRTLSSRVRLLERGDRPITTAHTDAILHYLTTEKNPHKKDPNNIT